MMKRKIVSLLSLLMLTLMVSQTANAYVLKPYKWQKSSNSTLYIAVMWGDRLQTSGSVIRNGFEAALSDWHIKQTHIRYNVSTSTSNNVLNSYYLVSDTEYG